MNDFLQTLRSSQADRQKNRLTRKSYDNAYYNALPQYQYVNQTVPAYPGLPQAENAADQTDLQAVLDRLNECIGKMTLQQKMMVDAQEKTADMLERQVIGLERILDHLNI